jgi:hypothetical protein
MKASGEAILPAFIGANSSAFSPTASQLDEFSDWLIILDWLLDTALPALFPMSHFAPAFRFL